MHQAIKVVGLQPLDCWDSGFESRWEHGYIALVTVVCCVDRNPFDRPITRPGEAYRMCVSYGDQMQQNPSVLITGEEEMV